MVVAFSRSLTKHSDKAAVQAWKARLFGVGHDTSAPMSKWLERRSFPPQRIENPGGFSDWILKNPY